MLYLPNVIISVSIGILVLIIVNQIYLYNQIKLLEIQKLASISQCQIEMISTSLQKVVKHQVPQDIYRSKDEDKVSGHLFSEKEIEDLCRQLSSMTLIPESDLSKIWNMIENLQVETGIFFNKQVIAEDGSIGFSIPLADEPEKINLVNRETTLKVLLEIKKLAETAEFETVTLKQHFLDFITFYQAIVKMLLKNVDKSIDVTTLIMNYQEEAQRLLSMQEPYDYQYNTYEFWKKNLK